MDGEARATTPAYGLKVWSSADWRRAATGWLDERLAESGVRRTGEVDQPHLRPWGTVLRAPTTRGPVWLKAPGPETAFEVALYGLLGKAVPGRVLPPIAVDVGRGWLLLPDGGTALGDRLDEIDLIDAMVTILPRYAELQRDLAPHVEELLAFGITDMRAAAMPARFDEAVEVVGAYLTRWGGAADRARHERVIGMRDTFAGWCERLAEAAVPASLDHNDLHAWNVLVGGADEPPRPDRPRFYDWGDAVVAHPFSSLLVGLAFPYRFLDIAPDDPRIQRLRDAYLEAFTDVAPRAALVEELELACRVAKVARALTWDRSLRAQGYAEAGEFAEAPMENLHAVLAESAIGLSADAGGPTDGGGPID